MNLLILNTNVYSLITNFNNIPSQFNTINDIAVDNEDNIYVFEDYIIKKIKPSGIVQILLNDPVTNAVFENIY